MTGPEVATIYRLTHPFRIEATEEPLPPLTPGDVLLRPLLTGVCGSDLKLYSGSRDRAALVRKLPVALLHEAVAEVLAVGDGVGLMPGERVVPMPNIPCTIAHPDRHPTRELACYACRPGGVGSNYCLDGYFLSSDGDGMARTAFVHPAACVLPVPDRVPDSLAVLTEPMASILAGLERLDLSSSSGLLLILGNGTLAILTAIALRITAGVRPEQVLVTGHHWEARAQAFEGIAQPVTADSQLTGPTAGVVDAVFECVGGKASAETVSLAVEMLRPGGTGVLFGPSERPFLFDTRKIIDKGLTFVGSNRATCEHFQQTLELFEDPDLWPLLERALGSKQFVAEDADSLDDALYHAWSKTESGRTVIAWE